MNIKLNAYNLIPYKNFRNVLFILLKGIIINKNIIHINGVDFF